VNEKVVPTLPNARYVLQAGELEHARHATERDQASYFADNFEPIAVSKQWWLLEGDQEIAPGVELIRMPGHNRDMMGVRLSGGGQTALFLADLVPMSAHLGTAWIMGFDLFPMETLANKKKWLPEMVRGGWLALFGHDPKMPAAKLREVDGKIVAEAVAID
jgi:glyoxylase-like metal-dependent hydrolase (beta-lactamase superfamily II)